MAGNLLQRYLALLRAQMAGGGGDEEEDGEDDDLSHVDDDDADEVEDVQHKPETETAVKNAAESPLLVSGPPDARALP